MSDFMMRALIVGGLVTVAALCFERGARHARMATRFGWTVALLSVLVLPWLPRFLQSNAAAEVVPQISAPIVIVSAATQLETGINVLLVGWLLLSLVTLVCYAVSYVRLQRARRHWQPTELAEANVYVSDVFGPAIFGFIKPRIVVPEWVRTASPEEQQMIVLHEREHVRAFDHLQVLLTIMATVLQPWNPFVWLQSRRLRFAIEADCDQRVLGSVPDVRKYATLLLDVGSRRNGLLLTAALAEHRNGLERRLTMLAQSFIRNRGKALLLGVLGLGVMVVACESRLPQEPVRPAATQTPSEESGVKRRIGVTIPDRPVMVSELVARHYPPLLREAGIGGNVTVRALVHPDGKVDGFELVKSSGHPALDEAGMRIVREMQLFPLRTTTGVVNVRAEEMTLVFDPKQTGGPLRATMKKTPLRAVGVDEPAFTPYTVMPAVANREEVMAALQSAYPPLLKNAGVGGTVLAWVHVDELGQVTDARVKTSSGRTELDKAGLEVVHQMRFKPAENKGVPVGVWIQLPVVFKTQ